MAIGTLTRGAFIPANTRNFPIASSAFNYTDNQYLYNHESGFDADALP